MPKNSPPAITASKALILLIACTLIYGFCLIPALLFGSEIGSALLQPAAITVHPLQKALVIKLLLGFFVLFPILLFVSIVGGWILYAVKKVRTALCLQLLPLPFLLSGLGLLAVQEAPWRMKSFSLLFPRSAADYQKIGYEHYLRQEYGKAVVDFTRELELAKPGSDEYEIAYSMKNASQRKMLYFTFLR